MMKEKTLPPPALHTLFVSRETSNCPLLSEMILLGKRLHDYGLADNETGVLSLDYGKRLLINAKNVNLTKMTAQDLVEIVDYDPLKNIMMVIGAKDPNMHTPEHWIVQKARHDINALLQITSPALSERFQNTLPTTKSDTPSGTLEAAKEILQTLRDGKTIVIKNKGLLFAGFNIKELHDALQQHLGDQK
jgi:hypothetical protein